MNRFIPLLCIAVAIAAAAIYFASVLVNFVKLETKQKDSEMRQRVLHEQIFKDVIRPTAHWVSTFRAAQGTLPSQAELDTYASNSFGGTCIFIFTNASQGEPKWQNPGVDFELFVHASDWNLFYQSWDKKEAKYWTH
jgi:hypothetical protein